MYKLTAYENWVIVYYCENIYQVTALNMYYRLVLPYDENDSRANLIVIWEHSVVSAKIQLVFRGGHTSQRSYRLTHNACYGQFPDKTESN